MASSHPHHTSKKKNLEPTILPQNQINTNTNWQMEVQLQPTESGSGTNFLSNKMKQRDLLPSLHRIRLARREWPGGHTGTVVRTWQLNLLFTCIVVFLAWIYDGKFYEGKNHEVVKVYIITNIES